MSGDGEMKVDYDLEALRLRLEQLGTALEKAEESPEGGVPSVVVFDGSHGPGGEGEPMREQGFVPLPPDELDDKVAEIAETVGLVVTEGDVLRVPDIGPLVVQAEDVFVRTGSPFHAIQAFMVCMSAGLYPPKRILDWLQKGFAEWEASAGNQSLDHALGLVCGRGETPPYKAAMRASRLGLLMREIFQLKHVFRIATKDACAMVAARIEGDPSWRGTGRGRNAYQAKTLEGEWDAGGWAGKLSSSFEPNREAIRNLQAASDEEKLARLCAYPSVSYRYLDPIRGFLDLCGLRSGSVTDDELDDAVRRVAPENPSDYWSPAS